MKKMPNEPNPYEFPAAASGEPTLVGKSATAVDGKSPQPPLLKDLSFWGMTATQFLGAFNDNVFKQLLLLIAVSATVGASAESEEQDLQGYALLVFSIPFLLFSGFAGFLSERHSKRSMIVLCKVGEIVVMALGAGAFALRGDLGTFALWGVLCLMGTQSAFFGPGKYGILPEMIRRRELPQANGIFLMTTFLAIIFGAATAGGLKVLFEGRLFIAGGVCVGIAVLGTATSLLVRRLPAARPDLEFRFSALSVPADVWRMLRRDKALSAAILASCMFWLIGGIVQPSINSLGNNQLLKGLKTADLWTSLMVAAVGVGIAAGCLSAGWLSRGKVNFALMRIGAWGCTACLLVISIPGTEGKNLLGYWGSFAMFIVTGVFTGFFAVPLQVFLQSRPPEGMKGRVIATTNLANWIAILAAALLYIALEPLTQFLEWPRSSMFAFAALFMLPVAILYHPKSESLE